MIVISASGLSISASPVGLLRVTLKISLPSWSPSSVIERRISFSVSPGLKVSIPLSSA